VQGRVRVNRKIKIVCVQCGSGAGDRLEPEFPIKPGLDTPMMGRLVEFFVDADTREVRCEACVTEVERE
jgi:hypothetical protein